MKLLPHDSHLNILLDSSLLPSFRSVSMEFMSFCLCLENHNFIDLSGIPDSSDEILTYKTELEAKADCIESVDRKLVEEYSELKLTIRELEAELKQREDLINSKSNKLQQMKQSWFDSLSSLVERINANFSSHFSRLGFAGEVGLSAGQHENDFENYGLRLRVKFRDSEPLQELTY